MTESHPQGRTSGPAVRDATFLSTLQALPIDEAIIGLDHARLFQAFTQLEARPGRREDGTGLGLLLSKKLAQLLGGDVGVTSEWGAGSRFVVTLEEA